MRNFRAIVMVVLSLVAGISALSLATRWLNAQNTIATNSVVVASVDLAAGQTIEPRHLRTIEWPAGNVPTGAFKEMALLKDRVTRTGITRDEPVLESRLAAPGTRGGMAAIIKEGMRAITVKVNNVVGVAGFALPGTFVDVMVNVAQRGGQNQSSISKIVLERILVLAVEQETGTDNTKPKVVNAVTLEVTPLEAEKIDLARSVGNLSLVLRNSIDDLASTTSGATEDLLMGRSAPAPAVRAVRQVAEKAPEPQKICVESWVGTSRKTECF